MEPHLPPISKALPPFLQNTQAMGKQKKGVLVQRPRDKAGQPCEAPGCKRTECSRWLATGRCCTSIDCQAFFGVGKGKAVAAALAAAEEEAAVAASLSAAKKKQKLASPAAQSPAAPSAKPWRAPLKPGEALLELGAGTEKYLDEFEHRELRAIAQYRHGTLVASQPFTVLNVRLDDDDGVLDWSFLVACKIDGGYHEEDSSDEDEDEDTPVCEPTPVREPKESTRWVSFGVVARTGGGLVETASRSVLRA